MRGSAGTPGDPGHASGRSAGPTKRPPAATTHSELAGLGIMLGLATALFALGGNWIDGRLGTKPLFVLMGTFLGFGGGFWSMYSRLVLQGRKNEAEQDAELDD
jgi:F0F1-type ATP synthase assembly protein I